MQLTASLYKAELEKKGEIVFVPGGNSMWPTLKSKRQSVVVRKNDKRLNEFDVALYESGDKLILHRIINVTKNGYVTCGDGLLRTEMVSEENVLGVMDGFYRGDKFVSVNDERYIKKVKKWYGKKFSRKIKIKFFSFYVRVRSFFVRILKNSSRKGNENV